MTTITGHSVQFRPTVRHAWRPVMVSRNPIMAPALNALPDLVRKHGYGFFQIVTTFSNGRWSTPFQATLTQDPGTMSRELSPEERAELHGTDPQEEEASEQEYCERAAS